GDGRRVLEGEGGALALALALGAFARTLVLAVGADLLGQAQLEGGDHALLLALVLEADSHGEHPVGPPKGAGAVDVDRHSTLVKRLLDLVEDAHGGHRRRPGPDAPDLVTDGAHR